MPVSASTIELEDNVQQGLVFHFDYENELSRYCTNAITKTDNISTRRPLNNSQSNWITYLLSNDLRLKKVQATNRALVSNCNKIDISPKLAFPKWRHTSHIIQSIYVQKALAVRAESDKRNQYAITMRLSPKLARQIMLRGAGCLQERLTTQLKRSLGYKPDMWLHLEATIIDSNDNFKNGKYKIDGKKGRISHERGLLHMHGVIAINKSDISKMKYVVRSINNSSNGVFQSHELDLTPLHDADGWVDYCNKHQFLNKLILGGLQRYSRSQSLAKTAQALYDADRGQNKQGAS